MGLYNHLYNISPDIMPSQSVPLKEKLAKAKDDEKSWGQKCMDALETIGRQQFNYNLRLIENYEMVKGKFIPTHYFETEGYSDMIAQLSSEFELPNYLRHYDIMGNVINTMSGEFQKRPDLIKIVQIGDEATNEYIRVKTEFTQKYVFDIINREIEAKLAQQGIDTNRTEFNSPEEQQQYSQQVQQMRAELTPTDIQKYMDTDFLTIAEMWGQHQYQHDREYFNLAEKEKIEFEDMLIADRCFRHFYITPTGYNQETWNPVHVFFQKAEDVIPVEDGEYVGRILSLSLNTILDRYGYLMTKDDLDLLNSFQTENDEDSDKWNDSEYNWVYNNYFVPFRHYPEYDLMRKAWNVAPKSAGIPEVEGSFLDYISQSYSPLYNQNYFFVTEAYWKTQKKLFKITYFDFELNEIVVRTVDENYQMPKYFKRSNRVFDEEHDLDTYCETEVNEVWKGIKINTSRNAKVAKDIYLAIGPNEFQFRGDQNRFGCKLPVCGQVFSVRNSRSMSMVDLMKPWQIGFNVAVNQLYQLMEKEVGMFVVMDVNMFPNSKDWGGENSWDKWMMVAKNLGLLPADTSPQNVRNSLAATGGFLPKVLDLNLAAQMVSRTNLAMFFKQQCMEQVGFNEYRVGNFGSSTTATGVQQGANQSYSRTQGYFTDFDNYLRRCARMTLDINQYIQSQKEYVNFVYTKSDYSKAFCSVMGTDILLADLGVFAVNSQQINNQLEMMRQYALQNTTQMSPPDVIDVITMNSPKEIKNQLVNSYNKFLQQQEQQRQLEQQALQQEREIKEAELAQKEDHFQRLMDNNIEREQIKAGATVINTDVDIPTEPAAQQPTPTSDDNIKQQQLELNRQKQASENEFNNRKLALEQAKINADLQIQNQQTETARILKS